jgi:hypothetical protein
VVVAEGDVEVVPLAAVDFCTDANLAKAIEKHHCRSGAMVGPAARLEAPAGRAHRRTAPYPYIQPEP